jgi:hypothetical protein
MNCQPHSSSRYAHGTCFRNVILGHSSALSVAYFHPSRALLAREFRDSFFHKLGLSAVVTGPGFRGAGHSIWRQRVKPCPAAPSRLTFDRGCRSFCTRKLKE